MSCLVLGHIHLACSAPVSYPVSESAQAVVYDEDTRVEWYEVENELVRDLALQSTLALVNEQAVTCSSNGHVAIRADPLGSAFGLCSSERFVSQPSAAYCSGVLIDRDLVLTAAHCVRPTMDCHGQTWMFDFAVNEDGTLPEPACDAVYGCRAVLSLLHETREDGSRYDHALVQLDRPVTADRRAAPIAGSPMSSGTTATVIGYPSGLPVKVDLAATVLDDRAPKTDYFDLTCDTSAGSSGSGVFDAQGELVGIQVRGRFDYEYDEARDCRVSRRIHTQALASDAEQASYAAPVIADLCASGWASQALCGRSSVCGDGQCSVDEHAGDCPLDCPPIDRGTVADRSGGCTASRRVAPLSSLHSFWTFYTSFLLMVRIRRRVMLVGTGGNPKDDSLR